MASESAMDSQRDDIQSLDDMQPPMSWPALSGAPESEVSALQTSPTFGEHGEQGEEVEVLQNDLQESRNALMEQKQAHSEERDLMWREGLKLRVEMTRLKDARLVVLREMKEADKKHKDDCKWARKEFLGLQQKVKIYQEALESVQVSREQQVQGHIEEAMLASDKMESLKTTLTSLKKEKLEIEAEKKQHLQKCKAARKQVLQLEGEIEDLRRELEEKTQEVEKDREMQAIESKLVQVEIEKLQRQKEELLKQRELVSWSAEDGRQLEEDSKLARAGKLQLLHEVEELRRALVEQDREKERAKQMHAKRCKLAHKEAVKLQQQLQELKQRKSENQQELEATVRKHAEDFALSQKVVDSLKEEMDRIKLEQVASEVQCADLSPEPRFHAYGAKDDFEDLVAEEEFQRVLAEVTNPANGAEGNEIPIMSPQGVTEGNTKPRERSKYPTGVLGEGGNENSENMGHEPLLGVPIDTTSMLLSPDRV